MNQVNVFQKKLNLKGLIRAPEKKDLIKALALILCQRSAFFGGFPFGVAFFSAVATANKAYIYIPSLIAGVFFTDAPTFKYIFASIIIWIFKTITPPEKKTQLKNAVMSALSIFICGIYYAFTTKSSVIGFSVLMTETFFTFLGCHIFSNIDNLIAQQKRSEPISQENSISLIIVMAILLTGLSGIPMPFSLNLCTMAGIYLVLCMTLYSKFPISVLFALGCGFLITLPEPSSLVGATVFAISTSFACMMKYFGHIGASIGFLTGVTVSILLLGNTSYMPYALLDIFFATAIFAFLPLKFHQRTGIFLANAFKTADQRRDFRIKEYITEELNAISNTFSEFSRQFMGGFQKKCENELNLPSHVFDETSDRICAHCNRMHECWHKNFNDTYKYMFEIYDTIGKTGHCDIQSAPLIFVQRCVQPELFLSEFNHVYEIYRRDELYQGAKTGERRLVSNQYVEISKIISRLSEEIEGNFFFDEHKEKEICARCNQEAVYLKDLNVVKNNEGYYEVFFAPGADEDIEKICKISSEVLNVKMKNAYCKNKSIVKLVTDNSYEVKIAISQKQKDDEELCGDTVLHFETDKSKYYIILCDGMGSGNDASRESRRSAELLAGFLKAGFSKSTALNLINSTLALKMDREGFSTIDLCEIDLRSGKCEFVKIGGAQSYIKNGEDIYTLSAKGLPAGILEEINPDNSSYVLSDGGMIVMVSDGVSEAGYGMMRGEWIKKLMCLDGLKAEELAKSIVNSARKKIYPRVADDMSAVVINVLKINEENLSKVDCAV